MAKRFPTPYSIEYVRSQRAKRKWERLTRDVRSAKQSRVERCVQRITRSVAKAIVQDTGRDDQKLAESIAKTIVQDSNTRRHKRYELLTKQLRGQHGHTKLLRHPLLVKNQAEFLKKVGTGILKYAKSLTPRVNTISSGLINPDPFSFAAPPSRKRFFDGDEYVSHNAKRIRYCDEEEPLIAPTTSIPPASHKRPFDGDEYVNHSTKRVRRSDEEPPIAPTTPITSPIPPTTTIPSPIVLTTPSPPPTTSTTSNSFLKSALKKRPGQVFYGQDFEPDWHIPLDIEHLPLWDADKAVQTVQRALLSPEASIRTKKQMELMRQMRKMLEGQYFDYRYREKKNMIRGKVLFPFDKIDWSKCSSVIRSWVEMLFLEGRHGYTWEGIAPTNFKKLIEEKAASEEFSQVNHPFRTDFQYESDSMWSITSDRMPLGIWKIDPAAGPSGMLDLNLKEVEAILNTIDEGISKEHIRPIKKKARNNDPSYEQYFATKPRAETVYYMRKIMLDHVSGRKPSLSPEKEAALRAIKNAAEEGIRLHGAEWKDKQPTGRKIRFADTKICRTYDCETEQLVGKDVYMDMGPDKPRRHEKHFFNRQWKDYMEEKKRKQEQDERTPQQVLIDNFFNAYKDNFTNWCNNEAREAAAKEAKKAEAEAQETLNAIVDAEEAEKTEAEAQKTSETIVDAEEDVPANMDHDALLANQLEEAQDLAEIIAETHPGTQYAIKAQLLVAACEAAQIAIARSSTFAEEAVERDTSKAANFKKAYLNQLLEDEGYAEAEAEIMAQWEADEQQMKIEDAITFSKYQGDIYDTVDFSEQFTEAELKEQQAAYLAYNAAKEAVEQAEAAFFAE